MKVKVFMLGVFLFFVVTGTAQTGGQFAITQSVIANGGADSNGGNFGVTGTTAQTAAGINSSGGQFSVTGGFWQVFFAPTAATVSVRGKVTNANGSGISNVRVSVTNLAGESQTAVTNSFGNFRFNEVTAGEIYIFAVHSRRYQFINETQILFISEDVSDLVFIADW